MNYATVKAVLSGDTILLVGRSSGNINSNNSIKFLFFYYCIIILFLYI